MKKIAVIDIGSNSVRLMMMADGKVLYKTLDTTRLGEGLASSSLLKREAVERTAAAVAAFYARANAEGAASVYAFATAAVRSAENGSEFVARVRELCPLDVEVISGMEEAELGILGALGGRDGGLVDAGGASTEIVVQKGGILIYKKSVDIGVVRLKDMCGADAEKLKQAAERAVGEYGKVPDGIPHVCDRRNGYNAGRAFAGHAGIRFFPRHGHNCHRRANARAGGKADKNARGGHRKASRRPA